MLGLQIEGYRCQGLLTSFFYSDLYPLISSNLNAFISSDLYPLVSSNLYPFIQLTLHNAKRVAILPDGFVILHPFLS